MSAKPTCPDRLHNGPSSFERRPDLYAVRNERAPSDRSAVTIVSSDADTAYAVYKGTPPKGKTEQAGPVYSAGHGGPLAIPTGRVFVRLDEGVAPDTLERQFEDAGFEIERTLPYAPNAAWLRPLRGGVADALAALPELEKLARVAHVEPQLLMERASK